MNVSVSDSARQSARQIRDDWNALGRGFYAGGLYDFGRDLESALQRDRLRRRARALVDGESERLSLSDWEQPSFEGLERHASRFGFESVAETAGLFTVEGTEGLVAAKPTRYQLRVLQAQRLWKEHVSVREIASRMGVSVLTVRSYLAQPSPKRMVKPRKMHSSQSSGSGRPSVPTPRRAALQDRIVRLHESGVMAAAIADLLGKSDRTIRRYLKLAGAL